MKGDNEHGERTSLERKSEALFRDSVANTDGATRSRLNQARQRAMAELEHPSKHWQRRWLPVSAAAAAVVLLTVMLVRLPDNGSRLESAMASATDLEILLDADDLELIEDLDFYAWLDEQPELRDGTDEENGVG